LKEIIWPALEKFLEVEMDNHLWYEKHSKIWYNSWNSRNWKYKRRILTVNWEKEINIPRDRNWEFESEIIPRYENRTSEFDERIINMYWLWMSTRDIQWHIKDMYWCNISPMMVSNITDKILPLVKEWQSRPLEKCYPIIYLDAIHFKVKQDWKYVNKAVYIVIW
jgi:transposase-like protein